MSKKCLDTDGIEFSVKCTRMPEFIDEMNLMVPWAELVSLVQPHSPASKTGRPPPPVETMFHMHFMQRCGAQTPRRRHGLQGRAHGRTSLMGDYLRVCSFLKRHSNHWGGTAAQTPASLRWRINLAKRNASQASKARKKPTRPSRRTFSKFR
jgi:hypothetical protein